LNFATRADWTGQGRVIKLSYTFALMPAISMGCQRFAAVQHHDGL
jgi:hypothetical protein